jgi:hypothetical protein
MNSYTNICPTSMTFVSVDRFLPNKTSTNLQRTRKHLKAFGQEWQGYLLPNVVTVPHKATQVAMMYTAEKLNLGVKLIGALKGAWLRALDGHSLSPIFQVTHVHLPIATLADLVLLIEAVSRTGELLKGEGRDAGHLQCGIAALGFVYCHTASSPPQP